jgi:hypothetical protein
LVAAVTVVQGLGLRDAVAAPWLIDTDMGTDDWIAILDSAAQLKGDLKAITVVGNGLSLQRAQPTAPIELAGEAKLIEGFQPRPRGGQAP